MSERIRQIERLFSGPRKLFCEANRSPEALTAFSVRNIHNEHAVVFVLPLVRVDHHIRRERMKWKSKL